MGRPKRLLRPQNMAMGSGGLRSPRIWRREAPTVVVVTHAHVRGGELGRFKKAFGPQNVAMGSAEGRHQNDAMNDAMGSEGRHRMRRWVPFTTMGSKGRHPQLSVAAIGPSVTQPVGSSERCRTVLSAAGQA